MSANTWYINLKVLFFSPQISIAKQSQLQLVSGDDVVEYKHGEKSARTLISAGFQNLAFRTYNGWVFTSC